MYVEIFYRPTTLIRLFKKPNKKYIFYTAITTNKFGNHVIAEHGTEFGLKNEFKPVL